MSKLLIIGASVLQLPAIIKAKELGHTVAVADYNPQAIGIPYADIYFNASTIDEKAVTAAAEQFKPDGIMTLATDMPMRSLAVATSHLGLPGISYETAVKATDKYEMIKTFKSHNVESPWYFSVKTEAELQAIQDQITFPCILKPTDNSGSRGVVLVHNEEELKNGFQYSVREGRSGNVIIEEYMTGSEVSVEVMVVDGVVHILAVTDKLTTGAPHFVEMGHSQQSRLPEKDLLRIKDLAARAVQAIGIQCGPAHVELMLTAQGPKMIELGARMGGDCITTHLVPLSTGIDMINATIDVALGNKPNITPKFNKGSAIRYFNVSPGEIKKIEGVEEAKKINGVKEITFTKNVGDQVTDIHNSLDRVGFVIAQADTPGMAVNICEDAINLISIDV